jgi:hypothetical protein
MYSVWLLLYKEDPVESTFSTNLESVAEAGPPKLTGIGREANNLTP